MKVENEEFSSQDVQEEGDIFKLIKWQWNQTLRVTTAKLAHLESRSKKTEQFLVTQEGLLKLLDIKIKYLELKEEEEFTENWNEN